jgi:hypothetical protein
MAFPGCSVVVTSHDRWFLDRIATHILAWEGTDENPGQWHWFEGNFASYQADRERRLGPEALPPAPPAPQAHARLAHRLPGRIPQSRYGRPFEKRGRPSSFPARSRRMRIVRLARPERGIVPSTCDCESRDNLVKRS